MKQVLFIYRLVCEYYSVTQSAAPAVFILRNCDTSRATAYRGINTLIEFGFIEKSAYGQYLPVNVFNEHMTADV